jgi:HSP20 family protein
MLFEPLASRRFLSPFLALRGIQAEFERMLGEAGTEGSSSVALALYKRDNGLFLRAPLPGVAPEDIAIEANGNTLTLSGRFPDEPEAEKAVARHVERPSGSFSRTLRLPFEIDAARVEAKLERGVLEVTIPRLQENPPVKIQVLSEGKRNQP